MYKQTWSFEPLLREIVHYYFSNICVLQSIYLCLTAYLLCLKQAIGDFSIELITLHHSIIYLMSLYNAIINLQVNVKWK